VVGAASVLSQLAGAAAGPRIRAITSEENLLTGVLGLLVVGGFLSLLLGDVGGAALLGACVGFAAGGGKLAFDSILQRDAPDANRGRAFARFETRFQVTWVIGALIPVAITLHARAGFAVVFVLAVIAITSYAVARMAYAHRMGTRQTAATAAAVEIEDRFTVVSDEVKGRLAGAPRAAFRRLRSTRVDDDDAWDRRGYPYADDEHDLGDDPESWPEPEWADAPAVDPDGPTQVEPDRPRRRGRRRRAEAGRHPDAATTVVAPEHHDLAADSTLAWRPPDDEAEFPWQPPADEADTTYLDDVDPAAENPYPWTPDPGRRP
jgi:hypothetical protein